MQRGLVELLSDAHKRTASGKPMMPLVHRNIRGPNVGKEDG